MTVGAPITGWYIGVGMKIPSTGAVGCPLYVRRDLAVSFDTDGMTYGGISEKPIATLVLGMYWYHRIL